MSKILVKNWQYAMAWAHGRHRQVLVHTLPENFRKKKSYYAIECHEKIRLSTFVGTQHQWWWIFSDQKKINLFNWKKKKKKIQNMSYAMRVGLKSSKMALLLKMVEWLRRYRVYKFDQKNISFEWRLLYYERMIPGHERWDTKSKRLVNILRLCFCNVNND